jgi:hypothetical protein
MFLIIIKKINWDWDWGLGIGIPNPQLHRVSLFFYYSSGFSFLVLLYKFLGYKTNLTSLRKMRYLKIQPPEFLKFAQDDAIHL